MCSSLGHIPACYDTNHNNNRHPRHRYNHIQYAPTLTSQQHPPNDNNQEQPTQGQAQHTQSIRPASAAPAILTARRPKVKHRPRPRPRPRQPAPATHTYTKQTHLCSSGNTHIPDTEIERDTDCFLPSFAPKYLPSMNQPHHHHQQRKRQQPPPAPDGPQAKCINDGQHPPYLGMGTHMALTSTIDITPGQTQHARYLVAKKQPTECKQPVTTQPAKTQEPGTKNEKIKTETENKNIEVNKPHRCTEIDMDTHKLYRLARYSS